ncbi:MAG: DUF192 domain-containing protein [Candidatus Nitrosocosmicus sp.]
MVDLQFLKCSAKITLLLTVSFIFAPMFLLIVSNHNFVYAQNINNNTGLPTSYVKIKSLVIYVDLAITPDQQAKGLSIKNSLNDSEGMLFPFDKPGDYSFWMKDMKFPIDILWIDTNNKIVHIEKNLQPCIFFLLCPSYSPHSNSKYVLEINADLTTRNNITVGDSVYINMAKNKNS